MSRKEKIMKRNYKANRDQYIVENRIEKYGILPYRVKHTRVSSLNDANTVARNVAKQFKETYVDEPSNWKNSANIYRINRCKYKRKK